MCIRDRLGTLKKGLGLGIREKIQDWRGEAKELTRGLADYFALPRKEAMEEVLSQKAAVSALTELVARFSQRLDVLKAERNILDFSDLEQLALKLLVEQDGALSLIHIYTNGKKTCRSHSFYFQLPFLAALGCRQQAPLCGTMAANKKTVALDVYKRQGLPSAHEH